MAVQVSIDNISIAKGSKTLFEDLSMGFFDGEKTGVLGVNGSGKSTLLKIIADLETPDQGEVKTRNNLRKVYVPQEDHFPLKQNLSQWMQDQLSNYFNDPSEVEVNSLVALGQAEFTDFEVSIELLSGGWKKRLSLASAFAKDPDLLILDEPTNHLDWEGITWLEKKLKGYKGSLLLVSHDRQFLQNSVNRIVEISPFYSSGYLSYNCDYKSFLVKKQQLIEEQLRKEASVSNTTRREVEWLKAGVKARTTKSKKRMEEAYNWMEQREQLRKRNQAVHRKSSIRLESNERKAKKYLEFKAVQIGYDDKVLIENLNFSAGRGSAVGVLGFNGSGKTSFAKAITKEIKPLCGEIQLLDDIEVIYFDQKRQSLPLDQTMLEFMGEGGDYVTAGEESVHVASYLRRFLFDSEKMNLKISQLSGGERARILVAKLLLQKADLLILDEPTNDLDIETIEALEESLQSFPGLVILISHDRFFLERVCTRFLCFSGEGPWLELPSVDQWIQSWDQVEAQTTTPKKVKAASAERVKLSYKDKKLLETIEDDIANAEAALTEAHKKLADEAVMSDQPELDHWIKEAEVRQNNVDELYEQWSVLEEKKSKANES